MKQRSISVALGAAALAAVVLTVSVSVAPGSPPAHPSHPSQSASTGSGSPGHSGDAHGNADHSQGNAGTSGTYNEPQPPSNADRNSGGANGQCPGGPYCSTRDGSPSGNGNGNGQAAGKPCAGCVGRADNKNPHGQMPNGSDHNAGYECDRNSGIGQTNPAHTGCTSSPPPPEVVPPPECHGARCTPPPPSCGSPGPNVCVPPVVEVGHKPPTHVSGAPPVTRVAGPAPPGPTPSAAPPPEQAQPSGQLPLTGSDLLPLGLIGLVLAAAGIALRRRIA